MKPFYSPLYVSIDIVIWLQDMKWKSTIYNLFFLIENDNFYYLCFIICFYFLCLDVLFDRKCSIAAAMTLCTFPENYSNEWMTCEKVYEIIDCSKYEESLHFILYVLNKDFLFDGTFSKRINSASNFLSNSIPISCNFLRTKS
jgi:hypothetical protein